MESQNKKGSSLLNSIIAVSILLILVTSVSAVSPRPNKDKSQTVISASAQDYYDKLDEYHSRGICTEDGFFKDILSKKNGYNKSLATPFKVLAVLVNFSDNASSTSADYYDSLIFSSSGSTVKDYYMDISYGQLDLITVDLPSSTGWQTAPFAYSYYVNNEKGLGAYPTNSQKLVEDLTTIIDPVVDFSEYDNDLNGYVDVMIVIHAGPGSEETGDDNDIWSHKWNISPYLTDDNVYVSKYTMQPEYLTTPGDQTIGVICHELGHGFGLPDLYDTDGSSYGIGFWDLMSSGSWLGPGYDASSPAHPSAWSRIQMGFATPTVVTTNISSQIIEDVKINGDIYRLWTSGNIGNEYFLVENRQKTGYDSYIPGEGLLIWHIDEAKSGNSQEWWPGQTEANHYLVALEQADGLYQMEQNVNYGDPDDVFPGVLNVTDFNTVSATTSDSYVDGVSFVAVSNISMNTGTAIADFEVGFVSDVGDDLSLNLPDQIALNQNYPNPFNPTTSIEFYTPDRGVAKLEIYNITGQKIATILDREVPAGSHTMFWDGNNQQGQSVSSGIYLYRLNINDSQETKKMVLMR
jgi:immune inhibitor A